MKRLTIVTEIISPYRIPLFNALAERQHLNPHIIFLAETDPTLRQWQVYKQEIRFSYQVLPAWRRRWGTHSMLINWGLAKALKAAQPDVILCGGYNYLAFWQTLLWARMRKIPFLLWSESTSDDIRSGQPWVEFLKREFSNRCTGFVVPGISAREYLVSRGYGESFIFTAPNAVDNSLFMREAAKARQNDAETRSRCSLPQKYFLYVGRLVREKGVFDLLSAYQRLSPERRDRIALILAGEGAERDRLEELASRISPGRVLFPGFVHREELAAYYGLADMLILVSHTEPWGLVVNEAMACGLPVIVSRTAGCAADLVRGGWNGKLVTPGDVEELTEAMSCLEAHPEVCCEMGLRGAECIAAYSPRAWSDGVAAAVARVETLQ